MRLMPFVRLGCLLPLLFLSNTFFVGGGEVGTDVFFLDDHTNGIEAIHRVYYDANGFVSGFEIYRLHQPAESPSRAMATIDAAVRTVAIRGTWTSARTLVFEELRQGDDWLPWATFILSENGRSVERTVHNLDQQLGTELLDARGSYVLTHRGQETGRVLVTEDAVREEFRSGTSRLYELGPDGAIDSYDHYYRNEHYHVGRFETVELGCLLVDVVGADDRYPIAPRLYVRSEPRFTEPIAVIVNTRVLREFSHLDPILPLFFLPTPGADGSPTIVASSTFSEVLDGEEVTYEAQNLSDYDLSTVWVEDGPGNGVGQWFEFRYDRPQLIEWIRIRNGFQANPAWYEKNARLKDFTVTIDGEAVYRGRAPDQLEPFDVDLPDQVGEVVRITIDSAYPGTTYEDLVITEFNVNVGYHEQ